MITRNVNIKKHTQGKKHLFKCQVAHLLVIFAEKLFDTQEAKLEKNPLPVFIAH